MKKDIAYIYDEMLRSWGRLNNEFNYLIRSTPELDTGTPFQTKLIQPINKDIPSISDMIRVRYIIEQINNLGIIDHGKESRPTELAMGFVSTELDNLEKIYNEHSGIFLI